MEQRSNRRPGRRHIPLQGPRPQPAKAAAFGFPEDVSVLALDPSSEPGPVIAAAIHDGHRLPASFVACNALTSAHRRREEDPFTADMIAGCPWQIVVHRSRFATDLNRDRAGSVYRTPEMAWGLQLWREPPDAATLDAAWQWHDRFYAAMGRLLDRVAQRHPRFVVLDVHSYNHRRGGPDQAPTPPDRAPDINIGTSTLPKGRWEAQLDPIHAIFGEPPGPGRVAGVGGCPTRLTPVAGPRSTSALDVANDVAFQGRGELTRFVHQRHPAQGGAFAIEVKKFFMDEWTGLPDVEAITWLRSRFKRLACELSAALDADVRATRHGRQRPAA